MQLSHRSLFLSPLVHTNEVQGMQQAPCLRLLARRARNLLEEGREVLAGRHPSHEPIPEIPLASIGIHWHPLASIAPDWPDASQPWPRRTHSWACWQLSPAAAPEAVGRTTASASPKARRPSRPPCRSRPKRKNLCWWAGIGAGHMALPCV